MRILKILGAAMLLWAPALEDASAKDGYVMLLDDVNKMDAEAKGFYFDVLQMMRSTLSSEWMSPNLATPVDYYFHIEHSRPGGLHEIQVSLFNSRFQLVSKAYATQSKAKDAQKYAKKFLKKDIRTYLKATKTRPAKRCMLCDYASLSEEEKGQARYWTMYAIIGGPFKGVDTNDELAVIEELYARKAQHGYALGYMLKGRDVNSMPVAPGPRRYHVLNDALKHYPLPALVKPLLDIYKRLKFEQVDKQGLTPLARAIADNDLRTAELYISAGADPNLATQAMQQTKGGKATAIAYTPLSVAAEHGTAEMTQLLIKLGADPMKPTTVGILPWQTAMARGGPEVIALLRPSTKTLLAQRNWMQLAFTAGYMGDETAVDGVLAAGKASDRRLTSGLLVVAAKGLIESTIASTRKPRAGYAGTQTFANYDKLIRKVVALGPDLDFTDKNFPWTALAMLAARGFNDLAALLIEKGASIDKASVNGKSLLEQAVEQRQTPILHELFTHGVDPNTKDAKGTPLFHYAVQTHDTGLIASFIDAGVNINSVDLRGNTALFYAYPGGNLALTDQHYNVIGQLISAGLDPMTRNYAGVTADASYQRARDTYLQQKRQDELARIERERVEKQRRLAEEERQRREEEAREAREEREWQQQQYAAQQQPVQQYREPDVMGAIARGLTQAFQDGAAELSQAQQEINQTNRAIAEQQRRAREFEEQKRRAEAERARRQRETQAQYERDRRDAERRNQEARLQVEQRNQAAREQAQREAAARQEAIDRAARQARANRTIVATIDLPNTRTYTSDGTEVTSGGGRGTSGNSYSGIGQSGNNSTSRNGGTSGSNGGSSPGSPLGPPAGEVTTQTRMTGTANGGALGGGNSGAGNSGSGMQTAAVDRSPKYVWFEGAEASTSMGLPEASPEAAMSWMRDYGNKADKACRERYGFTGQLIVTDIAKVQMRAVKEGQDTLYHAKGEAQGYCVYTPGSKTYEDIAWCTTERQGLSGCAVHSAIQ